MSLKIVDYGAGNLASIKNGLEKIGADVEIITGPGELIGASGIVLPGVGSFGDSMKSLVDFKGPLLKEIKSGTPYLGICLGLQLLFESSDESPNVEGFGIFKGKCVRFEKGYKVPHMGWNNLIKTKDSKILEDIKPDDRFYFVHSYYVVPEDERIISTKTDYGVKFASSIQSGNIYAMQFHPEKSADKGLNILKKFASICKN